MNTRIRIFLAIGIGIFPFIFFTPLLFSKVLTLTIPFFAVVTYLACLFAGEYLSAQYKALSLLSSWLIYISIGGIYFLIKGVEGLPIETLLLIEPLILIGMLIGFIIYVLHSLLLKIALGVVAFVFIVFMLVIGEKSYENLLYYGSLTGKVSEPLSIRNLELRDVYGKLVRFDLSQDKYSIIQIFNKGYGYSRIEVEKFMKPALDKYRGDSRVQFWVIGIPVNDISWEITDGQETDLGILYVQNNEENKIIDLLHYSRCGRDGIVIVKQDTILFRGDREMANRELIRIMGR